MRTQGCREAMDKVQELCGISDKTIKEVEPVTELCKVKTNAPLRRCATHALLPITKIKNISVRNAVISEANQILRQRTDNGDFVKERLTQPEIEEIIAKHHPKSKEAIVTEKPPRFKLNKSQHNVLKRMVSLKIVSNERDAFPLIFIWAAERITKKK